MYLDGINNGMVCSAEALNRLADAEEEKKRKEFEEKQRKGLQDKENHDNLDSIAKNSDETNIILRELNEALKKNNELLEEKNKSLESSLINMHEVLQGIFTVDCQSGEAQEEQTEQINILIGQISESLSREEKVNWNDKVADAGVQMVIAAIGTFLKIKGIL